MTPNNLLCFSCMGTLTVPGEVCPHCGHDNHIRDNGPSMLGDIVLINQYQVGRMLGRGGFGVTYIGYDLNLLCKVAIKEFYPSHLVARGKDDLTLSALTGYEGDYAKGYQRALTESRMAASLRQLNGVVQVYNVFSANNTIYIIMEYVDGDTLTKYIEKKGGKLTPQEAIRVLEPIANALQTLHERQIVHRDVKPDNIMLYRDTLKGVLLDFGAARVADDSTMSRSSAVVSQGYAPPEQYNMSLLDGRIDQHALAATLLHVLTGKRPPDVMERMVQAGATPSICNANPQVNAATEAVIYRGMSIKAADRYPSIREFWDALQKAVFQNKVCKTKTRKTKADKTSPVKAIAVALSVAIAGGALAYFVPRTQMWHKAFEPETITVVSSNIGEKDEDIQVSETPKITVAQEEASTREPLVTAEPTVEPTIEPTAEPTVEPTIEPTPTATSTPDPYAGIFSYSIQKDDTICIDQYIGSDTYVVVPAEIGGRKVSAIGAEAFRSCEDVTHIAIPDTITSIGKYAFKDCSLLTSITIPERVTTIANSAFSGCDSLNNITIPDNVISIDDFAFYECDNLTNIIIPDSVTTIGRSAFSCCYNLTSIIIPNGTTRIGSSAFWGCTNLTSITLPDSVTHIGDRAFSGCENLISITLPKGVTYIDENTFYECSSLTSITIPDSITSIGRNAFTYCTSLSSVTLPDSLTSIEASAFTSCTSLPSITIPDSVTFIGDGAFSDCDGLRSIIIPDSVTTLGIDIFIACDNITLVVSAGSYAESYARLYRYPYRTK